MKKGASEQVIEYIEKKIQDGVWRSGMKISTEAQLQQEIGVSKPSVREAVERLVAMNILTKRQGDGTYINDMNAGSLIDQMIPYFLLGPNDAITILEFREAVEPACVEMFVDHYDPEKVRQLEEHLRTMEQYQDGGEEFHNADMEFHNLIAAGTGNPIMSKIMSLLRSPINKYHLTASFTIGSRSGPAEHRAVLNAIKQRDKELASLLMKRHIQRSKRDMLAYNEEHREEG